MFHSRIHIEAGDLVILFMNKDNMIAVTVTPGEVFHNKFGMYKHDDMIGHKFGSKIHAPPPNSGYIHLLRPTPELWTLSLPHRTQILYLPDIAYITSTLGVRVGGKVVEAGTGSGSMTHSMSRTVGSKGRVLSFEYHKGRFEKASAEFESHGLKNVTLQHRNVCKDGFGEISDVEAVFLDLPAPWEAIPHVLGTLRPDIITKICCFSPCLEQVLKTVSTLRQEGFSDVTTQEVLIRTHDLVAPPPVTSSHLRTISSLVSDLKEHEKKKEMRRVIQMRTARTKAREMKAKAEREALGSEVETNPEGSSTGSKRKIDQVADQDPEEDLPQDTALPVESEEPTATESFSWPEPTTSYPTAILTKPSPEMRGHTSYLTFASYYPKSIRDQLSAQKTKSAVPSRIKTLASAEKEIREGSVATEDSYGSEGLEAVIGTLSEEEMLALAGGV